MLRDSGPGVTASARLIPALWLHGRLNVWDLRTGSRKAAFAAHAAAIDCLAVSSDGQRVASGSSDGTIRLWNVRDWSLAKALPDSPGPVYALCFAPALEAVNGKPKD